MKKSSCVTLHTKALTSAAVWTANNIPSCRVVSVAFVARDRAMYLAAIVTEAAWATKTTELDELIINYVSLIIINTKLCLFV